MTDKTATEVTETAELRRRIARALHRYDYEHGLSGNDMPSEHHYGETEAVLAVVQPYIDLEALERVVRRARRAEDRLKAAEAQVTAARKFAAEMRDFCSPHGVAADYADRLIEAMDHAKEGRA